MDGTPDPARFLFSTSGRVGRMGLVLVAVFWLFVYRVVSAVAVLLAAKGGVMTYLAPCLPVALIIVAGSSMIAVATRRLHDLDRPGGLETWLPLLFSGHKLLSTLLFLAGTPGPNRYGPIVVRSTRGPSAPLTVTLQKAEAAITKPVSRTLPIRQSPHVHSKARMRLERERHGGGKR